LGLDWPDKEGRKEEEDIGVRFEAVKNWELGEVNLERFGGRFGVLKFDTSLNGWGYGDGHGYCSLPSIGCDF
jgi:hypothetical protein